MAGNAFYYDSQFRERIGRGPFQVDVVRDYDRTVETNAILSAMYNDMVSMNGFNSLYLVFHGTSTGVQDSARQLSYRFEGYGIHMGHGFISSSNLELLRPFRGRIRTIYLFSCRIAGTGGSQFRQEPSGFEFCSSIARMTGAALYASAHLQSADFLMQRHFNGRVFLFLPDGTYTQVQDYPDAVSPMVR